jgi:chromosome segregation ATPase
MNSNRSVSMRTLQHSSSSSALLPANQSSSAISSVTNTPRTLEGQQSAQSQHALTKRVRELEIALALSERQRMAELSRNSTLQSRYSALSVKHRETKTRLEAVEDEFRQFRHSKDVRLNATTVSRHSRVASASPMASDSPSTTVEVSEAIAQALERYDFQFQEELEALRSELELARSDNFKLRDEADALAEHVSMVNVSVVELARKLAELEGEVEEEANDDGELHQSLAALLRDAQAAAVMYSPRNSTSSVSNSAPGTPRTSAQSQAAQSPRQQHTPA